MNRRTRLILLISGVILVLDLVFIWINFYSAKKALLESQIRDGESMRNAFSLSLDLHALDLQQVAALLAADKTVQDLFLQGKKSVQEEGGGPGGPRTAVIRKKMYDNLKDRWTLLEKNYAARQMHFHLGPGALSFLRVHHPEKFGDRLDDTRHTIVHTNATRKPSRGFEAGPLYSGIRGVVPVFAEEPETKKRVHVGALEIGTSFAGLLPELGRKLNAGIAVLQFKDDLEAIMRPDYLKRSFRENPPVGNFFIESTNHPEIRGLLGNPSVRQLTQALGTRLLDWKGSHLFVTSFPLHDFKGGNDPRWPDAGRVLVWKDARGAVEAFRNGIEVNIVYAIAGFILIELLLFYLVHRYEKLNQTIRTKNTELEKSRENLEERVNSRTGDLAEVNRRLKKEIEDHKQAKTRLQKAREQAEFANRAKSELLSRMSHELRTPLNAILGFGQLMELDSENKLTGDQKRNLDEILKAGNNLLEMINQVLELSTIEAGKTEISFENLHVPSILEETRILAHPLFKDSHNRISIQEGARDNHVRADRTRLKQVLLNLIANAVRHNQNGGPVTLRHEKIRRETVRISISYSGNEVPIDRLEWVLAPFKGMDKEQRGIGNRSLGLPLTQQLVAMMNGSIAVEREPGKGNRFTIELPAAPEPDGNGRDPAEPVHTVLYIEDNPANQKLISQILLRRPNIRLLSAPDGILGLKMAKSCCPDLILLDIHLPGMDGPEVIRHLKANEKLCPIPVIALSADAMWYDSRKIRDSGFKDFIRKPIDVNKFLSTLDREFCQT